MKIDRLLGIVIYLLNRDIVNSNTLAQKFEVSTRTIQRDIETLNLAGIPIVSIQGTDGGYGIVDSFKLQKQITNTEDYLFIITALRALCSAYDNKKIEQTLERIVYAYKLDEDKESKIRLDLGVSREGSNIDKNLKTIEKATDEEKIIKFIYTDSYGSKTCRLVEPVGLIYKWYAWYLFGYCRDKKDYRLFKVVRMRDLKKLDEHFSIKHEKLDKLLHKHEKKNKLKYMDVKVLCKKEIRVSIEEYFPKGSIKTLEDGDFVLEFSVPSNEVGWKGILLNYGNKIKIVEPEELKTEFLRKAKEIIDIYR